MRLNFNNSQFNLGDTFNSYKQRFPREPEWVIHTLTMMSQYAKEFETGRISPNIPLPYAQIFHIYFELDLLNYPNEVDVILSSIHSTDPLHFRKVFEIEERLMSNLDS